VGWVRIRVVTRGPAVFSALQRARQGGVTAPEPTTGPLDKLSAAYPSRPLHLS